MGITIFIIFLILAEASKFSYEFPIIFAKTFDIKKLLLLANPLKEEQKGTTNVPGRKKFGALKLCPPGGKAFLEAFELACPMRRKRSTETQQLYRPASIHEMMRICCVQGCEINDLFPYCGPFATW